MAISYTNNQDSSANVTAAAAMQSAFQEPQPQPMQFDNRPMSFSSFTTGLTRSTGGQSLQKSKEALGKAIEALIKGKDLVVSCHEVGVEMGLAYPGIVVCFLVRGQEDKGVAYHTLIIEETDVSRYLAPRVENFNNEPFEHLQFPSDAFDNVYMAAVDKVVTQAYPGKKLLAVEAEVIPKGFKWEDELAVTEVARNALLACWSDIGKRIGAIGDINLFQFTRDESLSSRVNFNETPTTDWVGLPVRSDFSVYITATRNGTNQGSVNSNSQQTTVAKTSGYIDLAWVYDEQMWRQELMRNPHLSMPGMVPQKFAAHIILTGLENQQTQTINSQLMGLIGPIMLKENDAWTNYFVPRKRTLARNKIDWRDIGAACIEGNPSNRPEGYDLFMDTTGSNFGEEQTWQLCRKLFKPGAIFSLRVSEYGADTWYNSPWVIAATEGDSNRRQATINSILDAVDKFTNGNFSKYYAGSANPMLPTYSTVHTGYYYDDENNKRDINDIDYLAVMNLAGKSDWTVGSQWQNTFNDTTKDTRYLLARRRKMIEQLLGNNITYTGRAKIVTFTSAFIDAFARAVQECTRINASNNALGFDMNVRPIAPGLAQALVSNAGTGMFTHGTNQVYQNRPTSYVGRTGW